MAATTTSVNCGGFFSFRSNSEEGRVRRHGSSGGPGCRKLDGVAMWFINGVATAFFASLDRCSCIRIATQDDADEANDAPLILNDGNISQDASCSRISRRKTTKGKKHSGAFHEY